ncbi:hypothetical protein AVEN_133716-1 [Araneus ventricosus]|uniref:CRESS-DNA virus Rep endonuclease domain-containing protein n=1 Tax=Araneus ventricosus TaxID=182803 RepID=A0A4Y2B9H4_ARAVE|nr:hypothetical protein AVEN_133716-1 [Araneus ventricosus]
MSSRGPRCHGWCFTSFDVSHEPVYDPVVYKYLVFGRETCPDTGREHLEGFAWFVQRKRFTEVKKIWNNSHIEALKGTPEQASKYFQKDDDYQEYGG